MGQITVYKEIHFLKVASILLLATFFSCGSNKILDSGIHAKYLSYYPFKDSILMSYGLNCETEGKNCDKAAFYFSLFNDSLSSIYWNLQKNKLFVSQLDTIIDLKEIDLVNPMQTILSNAKNTKAVFINEAHHNPYDRIFTRSLLRPLKSLGYNTIALEGLSCSNPPEIKSSLPSIESGFYIIEPEYGNLLREAIRLGFKIIAYDKGGRPAERDINAAKALKNYIEKNDSIKIVVHCGFGHVREDNEILGGLLAARFKEYTSIDPLTINQTRYVPNDINSSLENPLYKKLKNKTKNRLVLVNKSSRLPITDKYTDLLIFTDGKVELDHLHTKELVLKNYDETGFIMVFEDKDNLNLFPTPVDIAEINPNSTHVVLSFPTQGKYKIYKLSMKNMVEIKKIVIK